MKVNGHDLGRHSECTVKLFFLSGRGLSSSCTALTMLLTEVIFLSCRWDVEM